MIPNFPSPDLAEELHRRHLAPPCHCGSWPLTLSGFDGRGHTWRCAGCLLLPGKCLCPHTPVAILELACLNVGETSRPDTGQKPDKQGVSHAGGVVSSYNGNAIKNTGDLYKPPGYRPW